MKKKNFEGGEQLKTHACGQYFKQNACLPFSKTQPKLYGPRMVGRPNNPNRAQGKQLNRTVPCDIKHYPKSLNDRFLANP